MLKYIAKRLLLLIPVLIGIVLIVFTIMYVSPGDPARQMLGDMVPQETVDALREELGLNRSYLEQLGDYLLDLAHGDFGTSWRYNMPVTTMILDLRFPTTLELTLCSMFLAVVIGIPIGILSAVKQYTPIDNISTVFALVMTSIPAFWMGLMLMLLFSLKLGWFPSSGMESFKSLVLPSVTLALMNASNILRMTRSSMLEVIRQDYIRTARAKGASECRVVFTHAVKNAMIPVLTVVGVNVGSVLGGAAVTETVFGLPGMGTMMVEAIRNLDRPLVTGSVLFVAFTYCIVNLLVDILYTVIDPRIHM